MRAQNLAGWCPGRTGSDVPQMLLAPAPTSERPCHLSSTSRCPNERRAARGPDRWASHNCIAAADVYTGLPMDNGWLWQCDGLWLAEAHLSPTFCRLENVRASLKEQQIAVGNRVLTTCGIESIHSFLPSRAPRRSTPLRAVPVRRQQTPGDEQFNPDDSQDEENPCWLRKRDSLWWRPATGHVFSRLRTISLSQRILSGFPLQLLIAMRVAPITKHSQTAFPRYGHASLM